MASTIAVSSSFVSLHALQSALCGTPIKLAATCTHEKHPRLVALHDFIPFISPARNTHLSSELHWMPLALVYGMEQVRSIWQLHREILPGQCQLLHLVGELGGWQSCDSESPCQSNKLKITSLSEMNDEYSDEYCRTQKYIAWLFNRNKEDYGLERSRFNVRYTPGGMVLKVKFWVDAAD